MGGVSTQPRIVVSRCILGDPVRYDGSDKGAPELIALLRHHCQLIPLCPEVAAGMTVPRPLLERVLPPPHELRLRGRENPTLDPTEHLLLAAKTFITQHQPLHGALLQNRSPSCGVGDTPLWSLSGEVIDHGDGLFTALLRQFRPTLPITSPEALSTPGAVERFVTTVNSVAIESTRSDQAMITPAE